MKAVSTYHSYSREGGYQASEREYRPEDHQYPKSTPYGIARDAEHEAKLYAENEPKVSVAESVTEESLEKPEQS